MTDEHDLLNFTQTGWFIAILAATWGVILRVLVGRHERSNNRIEAKFQTLEDDVMMIKGDIAGILGRLRERDRHGRHTWPGDHE